MNLQKYYFSFGLGHELKDYYQPIMAADEITAIEKCMKSMMGAVIAALRDIYLWQRISNVDIYEVTVEVVQNGGK